MGRPRRGRRSQGDRVDGEESGSAGAGVAEERERRWGCCCGCIPDREELGVVAGVEEVKITKGLWWLTGAGV